MEFRLELIHSANVLNSATGKPIPFRSYKGILSALGYAGRPLTREEIIRLVWPEATVQVGRNRLRVALVKLRHLMPGAILETDAGLTFDSSVIATDVDEIRTTLAASHDSVTPQGEFEALSVALAAAGDGATFDRQAPGASEFGEMVARAWLRMSDLAVELAQLERAKDASRAATYFDPISADGWAAYLLAQWRLGSVQVAVDDAKIRAPKRIQSETKFRETLKQIRSKYPGVREPISSERRAFWLDILECIQESRPDLMRSILSAPQALALSGKHPRTMHDLLEQATPLDLAETDFTWERSAARMIGLKAWLGDAQGVLAAAPAVLRASKDDQILRAVWNAVAVAHSLCRQWDEAFEALDRTLEYARKCGSEMYELTTRGNGAFFKMQEGRFEEADADYESILDRFRDLDTPQAKFEQAIAIGNRALIPVFQGEWEKALVQLEIAMATRTKGGLLVQMGILHASMALVRANLHRYENVVSSMRLAFLDAFESDSYRSQQFTFEVAAATLSVLGDPTYARSLAEWALKWRVDTHAPRSEAESLMLSRIHDAAPGAALAGDRASIGKETMKRLRAAVARHVNGH